MFFEGGWVILFVINEVLKDVLDVIEFVIILFVLGGKGLLNIVLGGVGWVF